MKKKIISYIIGLTLALCSISLISGCNDDNYQETDGRITPFVYQVELSKIYDGEPVKLTKENLETTSDGNFSVQFYQKNSTNSYKLLASAPSLPGEYFYKVSLSRTNKYNEFVSDYIPFTISKMSYSPKLINLSKKYDGNAVVLNNEVLQLPANVELEIKFYQISLIENIFERIEISSPPTDSGNYEYKIIVNESETVEGYSSEYVSFSINKWDASSLYMNLTKEYDTNPVSIDMDELKVTSDGNVNVTYYKKIDINESTYEIIKLDEAPSNSGNYFYVISISETNKYNKYESGYIPFSIMKITTNISFPNVSKIYDGKCVSIDSNNLNLTSDGELIVTYYELSLEDEIIVSLASAPKQTGSYFYKIFVSESDNYKAYNSDYIYFSIEKAQIEISLPKLNKVYDGISVNLNKNNLNLPDYCELNIKYYKYSVVDENSVLIKKLNSAPKQAGNYFYKIYVSSLENYEDYESELVAFTISKANSAIELINLSKVYDGKAVNLNREILNINSDGELVINYYEFDIENSNYYLPLSSAPIEAGNYFYQVSVSETINYKSYQSEYIPFTISKIDAPVKLVNLSKEYDGNVVNLKMEDVGISEDCNFNVEYYKYQSSDNTNNRVLLSEAPKNSGTYLYKVSITNSKQFNDYISDYIPFIISKINTNINLIDLSKEYDSTPVALTKDTLNISSDGNITITYYQVNKNNSNNIEEISSAPSFPGNYLYKISISETTNYKLYVSDYVSFTIKKANLDIELIELSKEYDGNAVAITKETLGIIENCELSVRYYSYTIDENHSITKTLLDDAPKSNGNYMYKIFINNSLTHNDYESDFKSFTINKKALELNLETIKKIYDGKSTFTMDLYSDDGIVIGDACILTLTLVYAGTDAINIGTYTNVYATSYELSDSNYTLLENSRIFTKTNSNIILEVIDPLQVNTNLIQVGEKYYTVTELYELLLSSSEGSKKLLI